MMRILTCALMAAATFGAMPATAQERPNVIFILADNVGYGDMGPYGGGELRGAPTPRTDQLAREGPFRGELGEATDGSIRTFCFVRWPGKIKPGTSSNAMFSIMDFMPTFARILGAKMPTDRPIDGVDQTDVLLGKSETGNRDSLLSFIGADLVAARWKQWRVYFTDVQPTGTGPQRQPGVFSSSAPMAGYPKVFNIEMDPHEDLVVGGVFGWAAGPPLEEVKKYLESVKKYPNPPAANLTKFWGGGADMTTRSSGPHDAAT